MTLNLILSVLFIGARQAVTYGYLPLSLITVRHDTSSTVVRTALTWSVGFMICILAGVLFLQMTGSLFVREFRQVGYLLVLFAGSLSILNISGKRETFKRFVLDKKWLYSVAMLQAVGGLDIISVTYVFGSDVTFTTVLMSSILYGLCFAMIVSMISIIVGLLASVGPKIRKALVIILSLLAILNGAINFFLSI
jgi:hypothetical protein